MTDNNYTNDEAYEISLLDLFVILLRQRWFVAKIATAFAVIAIVYALLATPIYKSTVLIMPPGGGAKSGAAAMLAASGMGDLLGASLATTSDTIVGVIKSPAVLDRVIDANGLMTREAEGFSIIGLIKSFLPKGEKEEKMRSKVRAALSENVQANADKQSGIITVSVKDTSQDMAVTLAQSVFDETLSVMQEVAITPDAQKRLFLEEQIKNTGKELSQAENDLVAFQKRTGMMSTGGAPSDVTALAALQARMLAKEIELRAARRFATSENPQVKRLQAEYDAIRRQFQADSAKTGTVPLSGVGLSKLPETSLEYAALFREYKFRERLYQLLLNQYESAKINELNDPLLIQALGAPTYPELKDSPKRTKIVILATLLGIFMGIFAAFIRHFFSMSSEDPEVAPKLDYIKSAIQSDLRWFSRRKK
ncbi:MAG: Wzz/FepE/Etk N-terminal domain-containing protein [Synergistaceae bacterium]|nr:Wzz/FepE/Etk N-terminal domain-containing protein [Synergistaceae bacterium]